MPDLIHLFSALPTPPGDAAGEWLHLVPAGTFRGVDGRGPYSLRDPQAVITASMQAGPIALDENHAIERARGSGQPSPAAGWVTRMEPRADGIWGYAEWTPPGQVLRVNKAYRGLSPAFTAPGGIVGRIANVSLTNTPNLAELATLHTEQDDQTLDIVKARAALGLPDTADEAAVLAAITANAGALATHAARANELVLNAARAAGVTADSAETLITALTARAATAVSNEVVLQLQSQLDAMKSTAAKAAATNFIDAAIAAGKPIVAKRAELITLHMRDAGLVEGLVNGMPSVNAGGVDVTLHSAQPDDLTPMEKQTAREMGVSEETMKAEKKRQKEAGR